MTGGHPGYLQLLDELRQLHLVKSAGYGTTVDPFANFTMLARARGQARFMYPLERDYEKSVRCFNLVTQHRIDDLETEFLDKASLMLCATAMLREDS